MEDAVKHVIAEVFDTAYSILRDNQEILERAAGELLQQETLDEKALTRLTAGLERRESKTQSAHGSVPIPEHTCQVSGVAISDRSRITIHPGRKAVRRAPVTFDARGMIETETGPAPRAGPPRAANRSGGGTRVQSTLAN